MIFPGFPGVLSFFKVFQEMWEPSDDVKMLVNKWRHDVMYIVWRHNDDLRNIWKKTALWKWRYKLSLKRHNATTETQLFQVSLTSQTEFDERN